MHSTSSAYGSKRIRLRRRSREILYENRYFFETDGCIEKICV